MKFLGTNNVFINQTRFLITSLLFLFASSLHAIVFVDKNAIGLNDGTSWTNAYTNLQSALLTVINDEVWIATGIYKPAAPGGDVLATFTLKSGVSLYGGFNGTETARSQRNINTNPTILSGDLNGDDTYRFVNSHDAWFNVVDNSKHVVTANNTDSSAILDGIEVSHGHGIGGGIYIVNASPLISNCRFYGNGHANGGAAHIYNGSPVFDNCEFISNFAEQSEGGAIYMNADASTLVDAPQYHVLIKNCTFKRNTVVGSLANTGDGGAIFVGLNASSMTVIDSTFSDNLSTHSFSAGDPSTGGAISSFGKIHIERSSFFNNKAHWGGAVFSYNEATVINSVFSNNHAFTQSLTNGFLYAPGGYGGAMYLSGITGSAKISNVTISNNTSTENGGGIYNVATLNIVNSILWGNSVSKIVIPGEEIIPTIKQQISSKGGQLDIAYSDIQGLFEPIPGEDLPDPTKYPGSIDSDPFFVDSLVHNLRLTQASPAIDAGSNAGIPAGVLIELDNNARRFDDPVTTDTGAGLAPIVDMGAYEFASVPFDEAPPLPVEPPVVAPPPVDVPPIVGEPVEFSGLIESVGVDTFVVDGTTILINTTTILNFEDGTGGVFVVGQTVEVVGIQNDDGSITADEMQISP